MAIPIGKLTILIGAGLVGSVIVKDASISNVSGFLSGAYKVLIRHIQQDDPQPSKSRARDSLLAQVNSIRQELQLFSSSGPVTIVTDGTSGRRTYVLPVIFVGVVGWGYLWWKGWNFSSIMFATRRSFSEARHAVGKRLDNLHGSISVTRQHLSTKINKVDNALEECNEISISTKDEVGQLREQVNEFDLRVASVAHMVENLGMQIEYFGGRQNYVNRGLRNLCVFMIETEKKPQAIPSSSHRPALELSEKALVTRAASLPPRVTETEPPSPSFSNGSPKSSAVSQETPRILRSSTTFSASGLKELQGISNIVTSTSEPPNMTPLVEVSRGRLPHTPEAVSNDSSNASWFRWSLRGFSASSNIKKSNSDAV